MVVLGKGTDPDRFISYYLKEDSCMFVCTFISLLAVGSKLFLEEIKNVASWKAELIPLSKRKMVGYLLRPLHFFPPE